ncbi:MAG TPA: 3-hydroxyacyl-CoA dehydrogenase family protein [Solirubrobacteraceae bacterium]|jgi:3-hydroxybutyryl-CoA dehydrogenase
MSEQSRAAGETGSSVRQVERVAVVGAGVMGNGIAQVVAGAGLSVTILDVSEQALSAGLERIERSLARLARSQRIDQAEAEATRSRIAASTDLEAVGADCDHVIETVVEDLAVKEEVLRRLDAVCAEQVIFASNTSQFSISRLAAATKRPDRVIGSHWFNPPPLMGLIELVRGVETSEETLATALGLAARYGKETVLCAKDTQGFITSRLIATLALEAMRILEEGIASVQDIDKACVLAFNHAMGPLDTIDFSGLDTTLRVADAMTEHYGERFRAPQNLRTLVAAGHYGRKSGKGFRDYHDA